LITNAISRRYAKALIQLGSEAGAVDAYNEELARAEALLSAQPELAAVLANPAHGVEAKQAILKELIGKLSLSQNVANLLALLLDRNRLGLLPQIALSYSILADEMSGVVRPIITTALPLSENQVESIKGALAKATGRKVVLEVERDPSLIGGVIAKIGDRLFDGSVKTQLTKIQDILQKG